MTETSSEFAAHLAAELGACVHLPATPAYRTALDGVYFPEASRRIPLCVVQPRDVDDISRTLRGFPFTPVAHGTYSHVYRNSFLNCITI